MICAKCNLDKAESDFRPNKSRKSGYQSYCKLCDKEFQKEWYQKNKLTHKKRTKVRNDVTATNVRKFIFEYLSNHPCVDCGESDPIVLEFDHVKKKTASISQMMRKRQKLDEIKKEIGQCEVRCANCHKRKTAIDFNWYKLKMNT